MLFVTAEEIRHLLSFPVLIDAIEAAHRRPKMEAQDALLGSERAQYLVRSAVDDGRFHGEQANYQFSGEHQRRKAACGASSLCAL